MKQFFLKLISDKNDINEKTIMGFISFFIMTIIAICHLIFSFMGKEFTINEFIYESFVTVTLGSFAVGSVDKFTNRNSRRNKDMIDEEEIG